MFMLESIASNQACRIELTHKNTEAPGNTEVIHVLPFVILVFFEVFLCDSTVGLHSDQA